MGARVKEVHIGFKDHIMKPLLDLTEMAYQVGEAIIKRAETERALKGINWVSPPPVRIIHYEGQKNGGTGLKLIVFDFDGRS
jgi:hypothetical protein